MIKATYDNKKIKLELNTVHTYDILTLHIFDTHIQHKYNIITQNIH